jgi:hypothetical protein
MSSPGWRRARSMTQTCPLGNELSRGVVRDLLTRLGEESRVPLVVGRSGYASVDKGVIQ